MIRNVRLTIIILFFGSSLCAQITVDEIIEKHALAIGGIEAWNQLKTYRMVMERSAETGKSISIATMKRPNKYRLHFKGETDFIKGYDGSEGWYQDESGVISVMRSGEELEMAEEGRYYEELALSPSFGFERELIGTEMLHNRMVFKIKIKKSGEDTQYYYVDTSTYLIRMTSEFSADAAYAGINFKTVMEDYQIVEGLLFPFKMNIYANEDLLRSFKVREIHLNVEIADAFFEKPKR